MTMHWLLIITYIGGSIGSLCSVHTQKRIIVLPSGYYVAMQKLDEQGDLVDFVLQSGSLSSLEDANKIFDSI